MKSEYKYHLVTRVKQPADGSSLDDLEGGGNWTGYLAQYKDNIVKGYQFTRLAVQEPYGVMILKVKKIKLTKVQ